jgi:hypothetical protein
LQPATPKRLVAVFFAVRKLFVPPAHIAPRSPAACTVSTQWRTGGQIVGVAVGQWTVN